MQCSVLFANQSINQSITLFVRLDINNNTVTTKHSTEHDRQGTESALTVAQEKGAFPIGC